MQEEKVEEVQEEGKQEEEKNEAEGEESKNEGEGQPEEAKQEEEKIETSKPESKKAATGKERFFLKPCAPEACDSIFVNGQNLPEEGIELNHLDRIIFGNNTVFCFKFYVKHKMEEIDKLKAENPEISEEELNTKVEEITNAENKDIDWEYAQYEKIGNADQAKKEELIKSKSTHKTPFLLIVQFSVVSS